VLLPQASGTLAPPHLTSFLLLTTMAVHLLPGATAEQPPVPLSPAKYGLADTAEHHRSLGFHSRLSRFGILRMSDKVIAPGIVEPFTGLLMNLPFLALIMML